MPEAAIAPPPKPTPPAPKPAAPPQQRQERPAPPKPKDDATHFDDSFAELDKIEADEKPKPQKKPDKKPDKPDERESSEKTDADDAKEVQEDEAPDKNLDKTQDDEKAKIGDEAKPVRAAELRTAYEKSKASIKEKDAEISRLKTELESKVKAEDPDKKILVERLTTTEKKLKEYEDEIRFVNTKKDPKFIKEFEQPYHDAFAEALSDFEQITYTDDEGNKRQATRKDLDTMLGLSVGQLDELAAERFGHSAATVTGHIRLLRRLATSYHKELDKIKSEGAEREKTRAFETQQQNEQRHKLWTDTNDEVAKKYPHWFAPKEGDEEGNAKLTKGYELADAVFLHRDQHPPEKLVRMDAAVRNKAAGFDRLVLEGKRKDARIAELEKSLKEFEDSDPTAEGGEPAKKDTGGDWETNAFAELDAIDRKSKK